jgi:hypothetical protein
MLQFADTDFVDSKPENPLLDIIGNFFCVNCGAGYIDEPFQCIKCTKGITFISVGCEITARDLIILRNARMKKV